jgi:hypothetical protein
MIEKLEFIIALARERSQPACPDPWRRDPPERLLKRAAKRPAR